jgi:ubiquinone biosynthesis protein
LYAKLLPELPRLLHQALDRKPGDDKLLLAALLQEQRRTNWLLGAGVWGAIGFLGGMVIARLITQLNWLG